MKFPNSSKFKIGDTVGLKLNPETKYTVENISQIYDQILVRAYRVEDYCLLFGWVDADRFIKLY